MKNQTTTARGGGAISTLEKLDQEPLSRFVARVESMRWCPEGESLARELGVLVGRRRWLLPEHREGWSDRFR